MAWTIEWCSGSRLASMEGGGGALPDGVLERVPTRAKRRKFERGISHHRTWVFAFLTEEGHIHFHEGP